MRGKTFFQNDEEGTGAQEREREKKLFQSDFNDNLFPQVEKLC